MRCIYEKSNFIRKYGKSLKFPIVTKRREEYNIEDRMYKIRLFSLPSLYCKCLNMRDTEFMYNYKQDRGLKTYVAYSA